MSGTQKLQSTIIGIFNDVLLFHKFYVSNNFDPLLIKKCLKEVLQNPGNPGHSPLVNNTFGEIRFFNWFLFAQSMGI